VAHGTLIGEKLFPGSLLCLKVRKSEAWLLPLRKSARCGGDDAGCGQKE
jgi:hypothetical protein